MLFYYDSINALVEPVLKYGRQNPTRADYWFGNLSHAECCERSLHGDESLVAKASEVLNLAEAQIPETRKYQWQDAPAGYFPNIPAYLAGHPCSMRRRTKVLCELGPINIYVCTTCSAATSADYMLNRGAAIVALVQKLQSLRPVNLFAVAELQGATDDAFTGVFRFDTKPVNLAQIAFCFSHVGFTRSVTYNEGQRRDNFNGNWSRQYHRYGGEELRPEYLTWIRNEIQASPEDIYIPAVNIQQTIGKDPVRWVNETLAETLKQAETL